jgi:hypothetical protein
MVMAITARPPRECATRRAACSVAAADIGDAGSTDGGASAANGGGAGGAGGSAGAGRAGAFVLKRTAVASTWSSVGGHRASARGWRRSLDRDALRALMAPPDPPKRRIGFVHPEDKSKKGAGSA